QLAAGALIGERRVDEAVEQDPHAGVQQRRHALLDELGPRGRVQQRLGAGLHAQLGVLDQRAYALGQFDPARLAQDPHRADEGAPDPDGARGRVERGSHPDLTWVTPSGAHELLVGDIDTAVVAAAARTPFEARRRVFVIERADTMIEQAANKMLKTLEEPPPFAHLLLLSDRPGEVLPTIASRCQHVRFEALPEDEVVARLGRDGVEPRPARAAARLARGDARLPRELATGDGPKLRAAAQRFARAAASAAMATRPWRDLLALAPARADAAVAELDERHAASLEL